MNIGNIVVKEKYKKCALGIYKTFIGWEIYVTGNDTILRFIGTDGEYHYTEYYFVKNYEDIILADLTPMPKIEAENTRIRRQMEIERNMIPSWFEYYRPFFK